jgi:MFS family permease
MAVGSEFAAPGRYRDAFAVREFRVMFAAYVMSMLGIVVAGVALTVQVYDRTGSPLLSALTFTLSFLPYLFGGTLLSGLVDRIPVRRLLAGCDLLSAALVAVLALPGLPIAVLLGLLFCMNLYAPLAMGARSAMLPEIMSAGAVVPARSLLRTVAQTAQICGYAAGGGLLAGLAPRDVLLVDALAFAAAATVLRFRLRDHRPTRTATAERPESLARDSLRGMRDVLGLPSLRRVLLFSWLVPFCVVAPEALAAPSVAYLGLSSSAAGWWLTAIPAGTVAGELLGVLLLPVAWRRRLVRPLAACCFLPLLAFAARPALALSLALLVLAGIAAAHTLGLDQLLLEVTPAELRGRAFTVATAGLMTIQGLGFAAAGALGEIMSPFAVIATAGVAGLVVVAALRLPAFR